MTLSISAYTYLVDDRFMLLTYEDGTTETFTEDDAERYVQLTGRPEDAEALNWAYTPVAQDPTP